jgi:hypothetical protein
MTTAITLRDFLLKGGNINKINIKETSTNYGDKNNSKPIDKIEFDSKTENAELYNVYFTDGTKHRYASMWILTKVEFVLADAFK